MGLGGGIDLNMSDRRALCVAQFDWTLMRESPIDPTTLGRRPRDNSAIRTGIGLVFKAGSQASERP
jgi:hypothetical protein